ncbi:hypothetical protein [Chroococcidiopsis sp. SAG 2025]|uniref:hypothetical protein n=1 Tax=Chroococcidiopsis sp. SAG 2025 TaxID=171389 RepID=UPI0029372D5A|nr:hypothetical protein [Chroococcidiopsis sp. SAG 2025]
MSLELIGFGLAGLADKNQRREPATERESVVGNRIGDREPTTYRDPNPTDRTGYR